jgi:hypothetical protein
MKITRQIIAALAAGLFLSAAALAQTKDDPHAPSGRAPPATSSTADDNGINPLTHAGEDYSPTGRASGIKQPSRVGTGSDPSATRESPTINGNGTAGEGP